RPTPTPGRGPCRNTNVLEQVRTPGLLQRPPARPPELLKRRVPQGVFGQHDGGDSRPQDAARLHLSVASVRITPRGEVRTWITSSAGSAGRRRRSRGCAVGRR